jgi:hypothetical protein
LCHESESFLGCSLSDGQNLPASPCPDPFDLHGSVVELARMDLCDRFVDLELELQIEMWIPTGFELFDAYAETRRKVFKSLGRRSSRSPLEVAHVRMAVTRGAEFYLRHPSPATEVTDPSSDRLHVQR